MQGLPTLDLSAIEPTLSAQGCEGHSAVVLSCLSLEDSVAAEGNAAASIARALENIAACRYSGVVIMIPHEVGAPAGLRRSS